MTPIQQKTKELPKLETLKINNIYGSVELVYATVYVVACNEQVVPSTKQRTKTICVYQDMIRSMLDELVLNGKNILLTTKKVFKNEKYMSQNHYW